MIALFIGLAVVLAVLAIPLVALFATAVVVDPGTIALVLRRGKATGRALTPGRHFVVPWQKLNLQVYPSRELVFVAGGRSIDDPRVEYVDDPLRVHLGDRAFATVSYTVRCQLDTATLKVVHDQYGPEGLWSALRDTIRSAVLTELGNASIDDAYGDAFRALQQRLTDAVTTALAGIGFELRSFSLREIDLAETGEVIQAIVRADIELEREQAFAEVRKVRVENDAAIGSLLEGLDGDLLLRYRAIESWRDILHRWNGDQPIPSVLTLPLVMPPSSATTSDSQTMAADDAQTSVDQQP